jgi:hypothetical protein
MTPCAWPGTRAAATTSPVFTPMAPLRLRLTMELAQAFALGRPDGITVVAPAVTIDRAALATRKAILPATV